jgi:chloride channel protein, CIC family
VANRATVSVLMFQQDPPQVGPLFGPTSRLVLLCVLVGVVGGLAAVAFEFLVDLAQHLLLEGVAGYHPPDSGTSPTPAPIIPLFPQRWWLPVVTTLGALVGGWLVFRWAPEAEGHGTDAALATYHHGRSVRAHVPFIKAIASALTIGSGGVAGREGPTAQISAGLGSLLTRRLKLRGQERRILMLCAMAAGLSAMFQAPLGMAIFAVEILYSGMVFEGEALIYTVISAVTAFAVRSLIFDAEPLFALPPDLTYGSASALPAFALLGVVAGLLGAVLPGLFYRTRDLFARLPLPRTLKPAIGGLLVGLVALAEPRILGTGYGWVQLALEHRVALGTLVLLLLLKGPMMSLTIGSGGAGGVFAPTIVLGAILGAAVGEGLGPWLPGAPPTDALMVVGMAAVFAGAARTPISTLIMVVEMTRGYGLIVPAMLANVLAFLVQSAVTVHARYPTLYENQVPTREESPAHRGVFVRRAIQMMEEGALDPRDLTLPRLVHLLSYGKPVRLGQGGGLLVSLEIAEGSPFAGRTVADTIGTREGTTAVAVLRADDLLIPRGPTELLSGDQLIALATPEAYEGLLGAVNADLP